MTSIVNKLKNGSKDVKASTAYVICSVIQKCLSLITMPLFARLLTTEEYGIGTVYGSTMSVVILFSTLYLPYGSFSPAMMKFEKDRAGYISAVNTICLLFTSLYFIVYFLFRDFWNALADLPTSLMVIMGFEMLFNTSILLWMGKARFEYKYKLFVAVTLITSVLGTGCSLLAVLFLPNKGEVKLIAYGVVISISGLIIMIQSMIEGKACFNKEYWKYALTFSIPLIPYYLSQIILNHSDRLMINKMTGKGDAALYGVAYALAFVLNFVLNAINNSFVPWMYQRIKENNLQKNKNIPVIIAAIMAVLLLGIIALAPEIIFLMAGEKYMSAIWVVPPVAMSLLLLFYAQLFINVEFYYEEKYKLVGASILTAVTNIILNYFGIKMFGFVAAGYTTFVSYILFAVCNYYCMKRVCRDKKSEWNLYDIKALIILFLVFTVIGFAFSALYPFRLVRLGIIAVSLIVVLIFKNKISETANKVIRAIKSKDQSN